MQGKLKLIRGLREKHVKGGVRLTIHDGLVAESPRKDLPTIEKLCHDLMTTELINKKGEKTIFRIDFDAKEYWYGPEVKFESERV